MALYCEVNVVCSFAPQPPWLHSLPMMMTPECCAEYGLALAERQAEPTPQQAAERFVHAFQQSYGQGGPQWEVSSFEQAAGVAQRRFKFLLAYLHSPSHQVCPRQLPLSGCDSAGVWQS